MKTENTKLKYLTLCLDQASNSPLHYRHGCIVVRGGKIIGQGFNDYRPGFDGGALKNGRIASGPRDSSQKQKHKQKSKSGVKSMDAGSTKPFTPIEGMGGGHRVNVPLSMHSEMMAIHSALAQSSTLACGTVSSQKPCFKLSGGSKRKARLRKEGLKAYVEKICTGSLAEQQATEQRSGKAQAQEWCFEASASRPDRPEPGEARKERGGRGGVRGGARAERCGDTPIEEFEERSSWESVPISPTTTVSVRPFWTTGGTTQTVCV